MNISEMSDRLAQAPVVPLIEATDAPEAVRIAQALKAGGLRVAEVVLRTDAALDCLERIAADVPDMVVGAGTVLTVDQAEAAIARGARFIVSPGLRDDIVALAAARGMPVFPGVMTPGEVQHAYAIGLRHVKFFPAALAGGVPMLKALSAVFRQMRFMPTGGVSAANLHEYLALPSVIACGGSWLTPRAAIAAGNFEDITQYAREARDIAARAKVAS